MVGVPELTDVRLMEKFIETTDTLFVIKQAHHSLVQSRPTGAPSHHIIPSLFHYAVYRLAQKRTLITVGIHLNIS